MQQNPLKLHKSGFSPSKGWPFHLETPERDDWAGWASPPPPGSIVLLHADAQWAVSLNDNPSMLHVSERTLGSIIHVPEEWLYRIQFIPSKPLPSLPSSMISTMPHDPHEALRAIEAVNDGFKQAIWDRAGREIVGVNNIGEITFNWQSGEEKTVTQKQWWRVADQADLFPLSEFTISLNPNDPQFPPPSQIWQL